MISYLRLQKLHEVVVDTDDAILRSDPTEAADIEKNKKVFATLLQFLDDQALKLIIRDAKNNGRHSLQILRDHYLGSTKPRVISMYCDLTSLKLGSAESVTEYSLRAETTADMYEWKAPSLIVGVRKKRSVRILKFIFVLSKCYNS